jgi:hypothetical protein
MISQQPVSDEHPTAEPQTEPEDSALRASLARSAMHHQQGSSRPTAPPAVGATTAALLARSPRGPGRPHRRRPR